MAFYLSSNDAVGADRERVVEHSSPGQQLADLKVFWGPEICRLQYLVHLLDTGRIKDEYWPRVGVLSR